jgi:hypothetical protein
MHEDAEVEVAAKVISDLLNLIPREKRTEALSKALEKEAQETPQWINAADIKPPRHWHASMRLKARVVCMFVRSIKNNHSPEDAAEILFRHQPNVPGSGYLADYMPCDLVSGRAN